MGVSRRSLSLLGACVASVLLACVLLSTERDGPVALQDFSRTQMLPTWKVSGVLNPMPGQQKEDVPAPEEPEEGPAAPEEEPAAAPDAAPAPASEPEPEQDEEPEQEDEEKQQPSDWVPPAKPWEPLAEKNIHRLERTNRELVRGDMENSNMVKKLRAAMRLLKKQFAGKIVSLEQAYDRRLAREARILHQVRPQHPSASCIVVASRRTNPSMGDISLRNGRGPCECPGSPRPRCMSPPF